MAYGNYQNRPVILKTSGANPIAGRLTVASGNSTQVVSTTAVKSDSIISILLQTSNASHQSVVVSVGSINPGVNVTFALSNASCHSDAAIIWKIDQSAAPGA